jgi:hypothetical protein
MQAQILDAETAAVYSRVTCRTAPKTTVAWEPNESRSRSGPQAARCESTPRESPQELAVATVERTSREFQRRQYMARRRA